MTVINAAAAQEDLYRLMLDVNESSTPITIMNDRGKNAVLLSEDDWNAIQETLYLCSIPGMTDRIIKAGLEPSSECAKYDPDEESL